MDISGTPLRALRAALFTALVVTLSTASHVLLSGVPLPLNTVALVAAAVFAVAYALAGRERSFGRIAALLIPLELAADTVFTTGQHACYGAAGGPVAGPLRSVGLDVLCGDGTHVGGALTAVSAVSEQTGTARLAALLAHADPETAWLLLAAHLGVGLLAAVWLRRGERALAQLLRAVAATTFRPLLLAVAAVTVRPARTSRRLPRPHSPVFAARERILVHSLGRRGPPCSASFA
ncbi:hypothetical protein [Streptomyces sp. CC219B]|uniref:hypothetical protein n=1 Tax=Streptomyces sp. CC219B TaxID=3044574 RepID=UPI0024A9D72E|nr:hypothetical protein [Streptomyces sp. CC219B]